MPTAPQPALPLAQAMHRLAVETRGAGFVDITREVVRWLASVGAGDGLLTAFIRHTSASLLIQENADPDVLVDLATALDRLAPRGARYVHDAEGPDDMPAHLRAAITATSLSIPVVDSRPVLGTWQGIYLWEHRRAPHRRRVALHLLGE